MLIGKKTLLLATLCAVMVIAQGFTRKEHDDDDKPTNLKILPKDISEKELHNVMKGFSMSLGVRCNYCHVSHPVEGRDRPKFDFASDSIPEKNTARDMMKMVMAINSEHLGKMTLKGHNMEQITCVTCHMGRAVPIISVDSVAKKEPVKK